MGTKVYLLVEWEDPSNMFSSYDVVSVYSQAYREKDLQPGMPTIIHTKQNTDRAVKIVQISKSKPYLMEQMALLELKDQKIKNMLQVCVQNIKELKSERSLSAQTQTSSRNHSPLPYVLGSDSSTDSETYTKIVPSKLSHFSKHIPQYTPQYKRQQSTDKNIRDLMSANNSGRRSVMCSTPLPSCSAQENTKLCFDKATQTDEDFVVLYDSELDVMEEEVNGIYEKFKNLESHVNQNGLMSMSESEYNNDTSNVDQNVGESFAEPNNIKNEEVGAEEIIECTGEEKILNSNSKTLRVRRMSAQTTNNIEIVNDVDMVPIGDGNAKVPKRLLNDIDWTSHTSATRQLLQAIFPRRVLATHSLTGKRSPAFLDRPAKQILDPLLVDDIVQTVSTRCKVAKNLVRSCITIKCTDEAKLYRNRQNYNEARKRQQKDGENMSPSTASSDESQAVINEFLPVKCC